MSTAEPEQENLLRTLVDRVSLRFHSRVRQFKQNGLTEETAVRKAVQTLVPRGEEDIVHLLSKDPSVSWAGFEQEVRDRYLSDPEFFATALQALATHLVVGVGRNNGLS